MARQPHRGRPRPDRGGHRSNGPSYGRSATGGPTSRHGPPGRRSGPHRPGPGGHGQRPGIAPHPQSAPTGAGPQSEVWGTLELSERGDGYLRNPLKNYAVLPADPWLPAELARRLRLRGGEALRGTARASGGPNGAPCLVSIETIGGRPPGDYSGIVPFEDLTVVDPHDAIRFETPGGPLTMRVLDLMTPIGRGQRGLIVAPPRTGKTILLTQMAAAIRANHPDLALMMLLIDERPEEVTEMRRSIGAGSAAGAADTEPDPLRPEVVFSSNDKDVESHIRLARLMIARAKRRVELGQDVLILLDSLTRLGRAFNHFVGSSGRTMSGGIDIRALVEPKSMFGAARKIENGGSMTIIASALIETGSRMDEFIFQEFKGTGNMEIVLTRELANLRIWPAVDLQQSGTRKEELLLPPGAIDKIHRIRRKLSSMGQPKQMETLVQEIGRHESNAAFLAAQAG